MAGDEFHRRHHRKTDSVAVRIRAKAFGHYDGGWQFEPRAFRPLVGRHAADDFQVLEIELR